RRHARRIPPFDERGAHRHKRTQQGRDNYGYLGPHISIVWGARLRRRLRRGQAHLFTIHCMSAHAALTLGLLAWTLLARHGEAESAAQAAAASGRISVRVVSITCGSIADAVV